MTMKPVVTTLHLPPTLHASLRQLALMRGASFRTVVQQILDDYVTDDAAPRDVKEAVRRARLDRRHQAPTKPEAHA